MGLRVTNGLALGFIAIVTAIFLLLGLLLTGYVHGRNDRSALNRLRQEAALAASMASAPVGSSSSSAAAQIAQDISNAIDERVTIFSTDGTPLADSSTDPSTIANQAQSSEFTSAMNGTTNQAQRDDPVSGRATWYVASPIRSGTSIVGVVRLSVPKTDLGAGYSGEAGTLILLLLGAAGITLLSIWVFTRVAVRPMTKIVAATQQFSSGDLSARAAVDASGDFASVAVAFNEMADELQSTFDTIELERRRLDSVVEHLGDGILIVDDEDKVALMNLAAEKLVGVHRSWAIGRTYAQVLRDYELAAVVRDGRTSGQISGAPATHFIEMGRPRRAVQAFSYPIPSDSTPLVLVVLRDITEFKRTEAVRRDFVANVSHDLRTPIASMKALVETLLDGALEDESVARVFLSRMQIEVDDLARLVEELLQLSRAEAGQIELHVGAGNIEAVTRRVSDRMQAQAKLKQINIVLQSEPELPWAVFDSDRVEQVLVNLVHNAIKFTPVGGTIRVRCRTEADEVIVSVEDSGPGLAREDLDRVFERFYKADRSRSAAGSGLGLAIAKHLIQLHGGRIWAESDYGSGATFSFALPRAGDDEANRDEPVEFPSTTETSRT